MIKLNIGFFKVEIIYFSPGSGIYVSEAGYSKN
jgi:hypothetical protein